MKNTMSRILMKYVNFVLFIKSYFTGRLFNIPIEELNMSLFDLHDAKFNVMEKTITDVHRSLVVKICTSEGLSFQLRVAKVYIDTPVEKLCEAQAHTGNQLILDYCSEEKYCDLYLCKSINILSIFKLNSLVSSLFVDFSEIGRYLETAQTIYYAPYIQDYH